MNPCVWQALACKHARYSVLLTERVCGGAHELEGLAELLERLKRHGRRIDRHCERLLALLEPATPARH